MTNHPNRSKPARTRALAKLQSGDWLTWREIATLDYYRQRIPRLWPDNPELYDYRVAASLIDRRSIIV